MLILYWMGAVGAGDVKLFGLIGAWTGAAFAWQSALYSIFCRYYWHRDFAMEEGNHHETAARSF